MNMKISAPGINGVSNIETKRNSRWWVSINGGFSPRLLTHAKSWISFCGRKIKFWRVNVRPWRRQRASFKCACIRRPTVRMHTSLDSENAREGSIKMPTSQWMALCCCLRSDLYTNNPESRTPPPLGIFNCSRRTAILLLVPSSSSWSNEVLKPIETRPWFSAEKCPASFFVLKFTCHLHVSKIYIWLLYGLSYTLS